MPNKTDLTEYIESRLQWKLLCLSENGEMAQYIVQSLSSEANGRLSGH